MLRAAPMQRAETFKMRLSEQEMTVLRQLSEHYQMTIAEVLRMLARERHRDLGLDLPPQKSKRKAKK